MKTSEINFMGSVYVCWMIPLFLRRNSPGPTTRSHTHTHSHTYQKASLCVLLSSIKATILYFVNLWQRNQPSTTRTAGWTGYFQLQTIWFIYTQNFVSAETTQVGEHWFISLSSFVSTEKYVLIQFWASKPLNNIKSAALLIMNRQTMHRNQSWGEFPITLLLKTNVHTSSLLTIWILFHPLHTVVLYRLNSYQNHAAD